MSRRMIRAILIALAMVAVSTIYCFATSEPVEYQEHHCIVMEGDTLWDIAEQYRAEDEDIRAVVWRIRCANEDLIDGNCNIHEGDRLRIPVRVTKGER